MDPWREHQIPLRDPEERLRLASGLHVHVHICTEMHKRKALTTTNRYKEM